MTTTTKYAKLINETTIQFPPKNKGAIINYDINIPLLTQDGYKEFVPAETEIGKSYTIAYQETDNQIIEIATEIIPDPIEVLNQAKEQKLQENDRLRDEALKQGVCYKGILFDSDTDQKINLLAMLQTLADDGTIAWYGMDNQMLICNKFDLIEIGDLITKLHNFIWNENAKIKNKIENAKNQDELKEIIINYEFLANRQK